MLHAWLAAVLAIAVSPPEPPRYEQLFQQLRKLAPRADRFATIHDLVLRRDVAEFQLRDGVLLLLTPVGNRTVGAVFVGTGSATFTPPLAVERAQLRRVLGDSTLDTPIEAAVFIFTDSTAAELEREVAFATGAVPASAAARIGDALEFISDGRLREAEPALMTALLNGETNAFFAGYIKRQRGEDLLFAFDPFAVEEVHLLRRGHLTRQKLETVCQFQRAVDLEGTVAAIDERPLPSQLDHYAIETWISQTMDFRAAATVRLLALVDGGPWVRFELFDDLAIDSVLTEQATPLEYFRQKDSDDLWVRLAAPYQQGDSYAVRIVYHGDLIAHGSLVEEFLPQRLNPVQLQQLGNLDRWAFIKSTGRWFPRYSQWQAADMEFTFHTPAKYKFSTIGRLRESRVEGRVLTTRWTTEVPTQHASFNIGDFGEFEINDPQIPPVTVHINAEGHRQLAQLFLGQDDPERTVGRDVATSLLFFSRVFGRPLFNRYYATEIPYFHGQAFPGLIHLSWWTFTSLDASGGAEAFRAHEMAHQWWGIGVEPVDYRDAWLAEGFAEFAGLWFMRETLRSDDLYFQKLRDARDAIRRLGDAPPAIALGYRALQHNPAQYFPVIYQKGAWVLHMIRNMMTDFGTMNSEPFTAMMQDFYKTYRGGRATTKDFQTVVEQHAGLSMDWFFDQWVNGTALPKYAYSWRSESVGDGRYKVRFRVRQSDVPAGFVMPIPVAIHYAAGSPTIIRVTARGPLTDAEIVLPRDPKRIEFNLQESVLAAEAKEESWRP